MDLGIASLRFRLTLPRILLMGVVLFAGCFAHVSPSDGQTGPPNIVRVPYEPPVSKPSAGSPGKLPSANPSSVAPIEYRPLPSGNLGGPVPTNLNQARPSNINLLPTQTIEFAHSPQMVSPRVLPKDLKFVVAQPDIPQPKKLILEAKETNPHVARMVEPTLTLDLTVGLSKILVFKEAPKRVQMDTDEKSGVAAFTIVTEKEISLVGKKPGQTVLNLWFADPKNPANTSLYSYLVRVSPNPQTQLHVREQLEKYYKQLEKEINHAFPDSRIGLSIVGNKLLVCGLAHDVVQAGQIIRIIAPRAAGQGNQQQPKNLTNIVEHGLAQTRITKLPDENPEDSDEGTNPFARINLQVINMLRVPGEQQVMLKVVVAEVNRTALRNMGINFSIANGGGLVFANTTGGVLRGGVGDTPGGNLALRLDGGKVLIAIDALKQRNLARTLAEPTLVALNGQSASFSAGGEFPVPVVTGFTAAGLQGVQFQQFGVQLQFTPTVTDKDRIRLNVNADVSTLNPALSANVGGTNVQGLNSRKFQTVVDLRGGETMAVAGLLKNDYGAESTRVPFLGDIPLLGRLIGGSDKTAAAQQELIVLVTPVLARPLDPHHTRPVPGSDVFEPSDLEFYLHGRLESHRPVEYNSPIRTDLQKMNQYRQENRPAGGTPQVIPTAPPMNPNQYFPQRGYVP